MNPILEAKQLSKQYRIEGKIWQKKRVASAVSDVSFSLLPGKTLAVIGETGAGKTTLAKLLIGLVKPSYGNIFIDGVDTLASSSKVRRETHRKIRAIFQNANQSLNPKIRVRNLFDDALALNTTLENFMRIRKIDEVLNLVGLREGVAENFPHMFSMGEKQRIAIARALILEPKVIVADEPLAHLDMSIQAQIINLLLDIQEKLNLGYVFIANDLGVVKHVSDDLLVMCSGEIMEYGNTDNILDSPLHPYTRALLSSNPTVVKDKDRILKVTSKRADKLNPAGCPFQLNCLFASEQCKHEKPKKQQLIDRLIACHRLEEID